MNSSIRIANLLLLGALGFLSISTAAEPKEKDPNDLSKGKIFQWQSSDGLVYDYRIPKSYDKETGTNLTFILHGSNLSHGWGFANHQADKFRPDDIVVSPDGTTGNGNGGYNFLGKDPDVKRFYELQQELKKVFKIKATFLYGHSQGSFFALHYAGAKPDEVQGVVAHASGVWAWTQLPEAAHHQAIVFMHGTQDPVVPYGQSVGGFGLYREKKYPAVRMRSLEGWNHWPAEHNGPIPHASQQLAWVEGMTSKDPKRQAAAFKLLAGAKDKSQHDFAAFYAVTARIAALPDASAGAKRASEKGTASVDALVEKHIAALSKVDPGADLKPSSDAWIGHLPMFLRAFDGVPKADALEEKWSAVLKQHAEAANRDLGAYHTALGAKDEAAAFAAGLSAMKSCYLSLYCSDQRFLTNMKNWADDGRKLKLDREALSEFKTLYKDYSKALEDGQKAFETLNKRAAL